MAEQKRTKSGQKKVTEPEKQTSTYEDEEVVYTVATPFNRSKLLLQLITVAAVALAICIGLSIFFKVDTISVSGLGKYQYNTVAEASEIQVGDSLLFFSRAEVSSKILRSLPYVKSVRVGITLPGTVNIVIEEVQVSYSIQDENSQWWLMSADGKILEKTDAVTASECPTIVGVQLKKPAVGEKAVAADIQSEEGGAIVTVTGTDRLKAAISILQAMEKNELLGDLTTVDVTSPYDLQLWRGDDYRFKLGDTTQLVLKLAYIKSVLPQILSDYPAGTLDVSDPTDSEGFPFTEWQ